MGSMVIFSAGAAHAAPAQIQVRDWDEFISLSCDPDGFWIAPDWPGSPAALAAQLRSSPWWDRLAFSAAPCAEPLLDGQLDLPTARLRCARAQLAKRAIAPDPSLLLPAEKLLLYLYVREKHELLPRHERASKTRYTYPVADALGGEMGIDAVGQLVRAGLLAPVRLVDRIRACPDCGSGHLSFVDVCPACASIEISQAPALHCFTCGHIGPRGEFGAHGPLSCPKCAAALRHIGTDYDTPTAQHLCGACRHVALEARIVATCFDCGHSHEPARLKVREVHAHELTWQGAEALRQGRLQLACQPAGAHLPPLQFRQVLHWLMLTGQRHGALPFSVLLVEMANTDALLLQHGAPAVSALQGELAARLRACLRTADATSVDSAERLWVLLPFTAPEPVAERLLAQAAQLHAAGETPLALRLRSLQAPRELAGGDGPDAIMARLLGD
ncbi:MAG: hypothetical protein ABWY02_10450 [Telluria sp.]